MTAQQTPIMRLRSVTRYYEMGDNVVRALDGIDLDIHRGEFIMVVGSSGSGKSTLMHILGCLDTPTAGEYCIGNTDVTRLNDRQLSAIRNRRIGFVFQQFNLLSDLTVVDNIALPLAYSGRPYDERMAEAAKYADVVGLAAWSSHRPTELSGGQSQRVAIARALINQPDIIFADEPTGNLDSKTGDEVMNFIYDLNSRGYTIIMVTHDPLYADKGTRRITMQDGKITDDRPGERTLPPETLPEDSAKSAGEAQMSFVELVRTGVREGLLAHKMRTALTMLGIIIAVAGVITMSSFSLGSKQKQEDQIRALGANLIRVVDKRLEGEKLSTARIGGSQGLRLSDMTLLQRMVPGIVHAAGSRSIKLNIVSDYPDLSPSIIGVTGDYLTVNNLAVSEGRFIDQHDQDTSARVAVIGDAIRRQMKKDKVIGERLLLGGTPYTIIGVLANRQVDMKGLEATGISDSNYDLLIPLTTIVTRTKHLDMRSELDEIHIQLLTEDILYEASTSIRRQLGVAHGGVEDFSLVVPLDLLKQKQQAQELMNILTICVSSIALIVGGIGIMNIMLASVTERIREIGVRRAIGATRSDIMRQFLLEAVIIALTGGIIGTGIAFGMVVVTCFILDIPVVISLVMVCLSVLASTATGLVFGFYPAAQAADKKPVEALRYE